VFTRRQFLKQVGLGMAAGAAGWHVTASPLFAGPALDPPEKNLRVALLADSHLPDSNINTVPARNLMSAVAEINVCQPPVDLVFFGGDLTDTGETKALFLGREILSALQAPCWLLPGEKDYPAASHPVWQKVFGDGTFSFSYQGVHFCGLSTAAFDPIAGRKFFQVRPQQGRWLAREVSFSSPEAPLFILSHAPLYRLFQPWQWWTEQAESLYDLLTPWKKVFLLHGHVHQNITLPHRNLIFQGLRSTAWPLPDVRMGLPTDYSSLQDTGRSGCGWMLLNINGDGPVIISDQVWEI
jgi:3',5'-cyclic-AMP phosphodiesterase